MKKIIATVLAMVMALALCSTAFAADITGYTQAVTEGAKISTTAKKVEFHKAVAAEVDKDGKQTNTANIAYYTMEDVSGKYVTVGTLAEADYVVYSDAKGDNVMMYLAKTVAAYEGTGTVFTNFGKGCGQVNFTPVAGNTYYTSNEKGNTTIYVADKTGTDALMVGGALVNVKATTAPAATKHTWVPTVKDGDIVGYTCPTCKLAAIKAANYLSIPADGQQIPGTNYYFPAAASSTTTTTSSPKTFDAGIAMYVGMALTSVAGSAVVIGKKKEF